MLGDRFEYFLGFRLLFHRLLCRLLDLLSILRLLLRFQELLICFGHRFLGLIDQIQCTIAVFGCLELCGIEQVLTCCHIYKCILKLLDTAFELLLLLHVLLWSRLRILGVLFELLCFSHGLTRKFRNTRCKLLEQLASLLHGRFHLIEYLIIFTEILLKIGSSIKERLIVSRSAMLKFLSNRIGGRIPSHGIEFIKGRLWISSFSHRVIDELESVRDTLPLPKVTQLPFRGTPFIPFLPMKRIENHTSILEFMSSLQDAIGFYDHQKVFSRLFPFRRSCGQIDPLIDHVRPSSAGKSHITWKERIERFATLMNIFPIEELARCG